MISLSVENQSEIIEAFSSTSRYLDDLLNIDNTYFDGLISQSYPPELQLNNPNSSDIEKKGKRKVQGVPQSQTAALPRPQEATFLDFIYCRWVCFLQNL